MCDRRSVSRWTRVGKERSALSQNERAIDVRERERERSVARMGKMEATFFLSHDFPCERDCISPSLSLSLSTAFGRLGARDHGDPLRMVMMMTTVAAVTADRSQGENCLLSLATAAAAAAAGARSKQAIPSYAWRRGLRLRDSVIR